MREIHFLLDHKGPFINHINGCYPFTENFIERNRNNLNWDFLSGNGKLPWSIPFIEKFYDSWDWEGLSGNEFLPWTDELIIQFADKWKWDYIDKQYESCLVNNDSIKWTRNIIYRCPGKYPYERLSQNTKLLNKHPEILEDFKESLWWDYISGNEYINWSEELIDQFIHYWNWKILSANEEIVWTEELIEKYKDKFNHYSHKHGFTERWINKRMNKYDKDSDSENYEIKTPYTTEEFEEILKKNNPLNLIYDKRVPWTEELIARFENEWDWADLSSNERLPWSEKFIDKYLDRWDFGTILDETEDGKTFTFGLSFNPGLPWSMEFIRKYESKWDWKTLTHLEDIPWSLEILEEFEHKWDWEQIIWNETMWQKVFYPCLDEEIIGSVLTILNNKV